MPKADAERPELVISQFRQDLEVDVVLSERRGILGKPKTPKPLPNVGHLVILSRSTSWREHRQGRWCQGHAQYAGKGQNTTSIMVAFGSPFAVGRTFTTRPELGS